MDGRSPGSLQVIHCISFNWKFWELNPGTSDIFMTNMCSACHMFVFANSALFSPSVFSHLMLVTHQKNPTRDSFLT